MIQVENEQQSFEEWYIQVIRIYHAINQLTESYGLNYEQYLILKKVSQDNAIEVMKLAQILAVSNPAISRKVNVLYGKKLITKERKDESDQRKVFIALSETGQQVTRRLTAQLDELLRAYQQQHHTDLGQLFDETKQLESFLAKEIQKMD
ncbi:MarR family winged helix-turn-helix transcriptional regulator [Latilactobacillus fuchuensis]|uniref:LabV n=1 Tax=Latilactobacillus fuchuensis TaxID=164393 RepID=A0A2N9DT36_9LACO|nr:MarR family transcriptional regulator [Latilactobacillus fuchuensis]SPC35911.1 LabV [Latilactobacillus fuchuensis]